MKISIDLSASDYVAHDAASREIQTRQGPGDAWGNTRMGLSYTTSQQDFNAQVAAWGKDNVRWVDVRNIRIVSIVE